MRGAGIGRVRSGQNPHVGGFQFSHSLFRIFFTRGSGEFWERLLEVADVIDGEIRIETGIGSQRFTAGSAAHAFKDIQSRNHESVVGSDERREIRRGSAIGKEMRQAVGARVDGVARVLLRADVDD